MKQISYQFLKLYYDYLDIGLIKLSPQYLMLDMNTAARSILAVEEVQYVHQPFSLFLMVHNIELEKVQDKQTIVYQRTIVEQLTLIFEKEHVWDVDSDQPLILFILKADESVYYGHNVLELLLSHVNDMPVAIYCKDTNGTYTESNRYCDMLAKGRKTQDSIIGSVDQDLVWSDYAQCLQENDQRVIRGETVVSEEEVKLFDNSHQVMHSFKKPFVDASGQLVGLIGLSVPELFFNGRSSMNKPGQYDRKQVHLTHREEECLKLMAQGCSVKDVSSQMDISRRTVEAHLNNIKYKAGCYKQFQLGFFFGAVCPQPGADNV